MAGRGRPPKAATERRNGHVPIRGEWSSVPAIGWQHGPIPAPPDGLMPTSVEAWNLWLGGWVAAHFGPVDLPSLRIVVRLYDQIMTGELSRAGELRMWLDTFGLTPKGRQDRRWIEPTAERAQAFAPTSDQGGHYA